MMIGFSKKVLGLMLGICLFGGEAKAGMMLVGNNAFHVAEGQKSEYNFSGKVYATDSSGNHAARGSVTLFDPVAGAGTQAEAIWGGGSKHELLGDYNNAGSLYSNIRMTFESNHKNATVFYNVAEIFLEPNRDFFMFRLETAVQNVTPVELYRGNAGIGTEITIVGNGQSTEVGSGIINDTGDRRVGFDVIDRVNTLDGSGFHEFGSRFNNSFQANFRPFQLALMPGYSGGSMLVNGQFAATNDSTSVFDDFGKISNFDAVPIAFTDSVYGSYTAVPEPASSSLFAIGSLIGYLNRRKILAKESKVAI